MCSLAILDAKDQINLHKILEVICNMTGVFTVVSSIPAATFIARDCISQP